MDLRLSRAADVDEFESLAGDFLRAREAEHNLILGLCSNLRAAKSASAPWNSADAAPRAPYFAVLTGNGHVVGAAMRTPPLNAILATMVDERAVDTIAEDLLRDARDLPGVVGDRRDAKRFATRWTERTGRQHRVKRAERIFQLTRVASPRAARGGFRVATAGDLDLAARWMAAFAREALEEDGTDGRRVAQYWLATPGRTLYLWEDGEPVSMTGASGRTPNGIRIGAVYTPPELRGRGYASNLVAAVSRAQLESGLRFCFLYTDLANPTSNHIYQEIGYEPVCDVDEYAFEG